MLSLTNITFSKLIIVFYVMMAGVYLLACTPQVPGCSDQGTISLVKSIIINEGIEAGMMEDNQREDVLSRMAISSIRTTDVNDKTGMRRCAAKAIISSRENNSPWESEITYTSEITDDGKQQYVTVFGLEL